jgi:hypothetical protein
MPKLVKLSISHNMALKTVSGLANHPALEVVNIGGTGLTDAALPQLATIRTLRELSLHHCFGVTDAGTTALAKHPTLQKLTLNPQFRPLITDACIAPLIRIPNLQDLSINETVLTYEGVAQLKAAPSLVKLTLDKSGLPAADAEKLKADLPKVEVKYSPADDASVAKWNVARERQKAKDAKNP